MQRVELVEGRYEGAGFLTLGTLVVTGIFLIIFTIPVFMAEIAVGENKTVLARMQKASHVVSSENMYRAAAAYDAALSWRPDSQDYIEGRVAISLGIYQYYADRGEGNSKRGRQLLEKIDDQIIDGLVKFPSNSNLWYLLCEVRARLSPFDNRIFEYLKMSYMTGPREGWIASRRLLFALENWHRMDQENQKYAINDIKLLWAEVPYHKYLGATFLKAPRSGKKIIYAHINMGGYKDVKRFRKTLSDLGWKSDNTIMYEVILR